MKKDLIFEKLEEHSIALAKIQTSLENHLHHHEMVETKTKLVTTAIISIVLTVVTIGVIVFLKK